MKGKRLLAVFLSIAMMFTVLPLNSYAILSDSAAGEKAKIKMVLLQEDNTVENGAGAKFKPIKASEIDKTTNGTFYLGIYTEDFDNIYEVSKYEYKSSNKAKEYGLNYLSTGISFNSSYLELEPEVAAEGYEGQYAQEVLLNRMDYTGGAIISPRTTEFGPESSRKRKFSIYEQATELDINSIMSAPDTVNNFDSRIYLSVKNASSTSYSMPFSGADSMYVGILKFRFVQDASSLKPGTKLFGFTYSPDMADSVNTLEFGAQTGNADATTYQIKYEDNHTFEKDPTTTYTATDSPQDIRTVVDFIEPVLYPASYNIKFYDSKECTNEIKQSDGSSYGLNNIEENSQYSTIKDDVAIPTVGDTTAGADLPLTKTEDGKEMYFTGWAYANPSDASNPKTFPPSDTTEIGAAEVPANTYEIKVYPVYKEGKTITFNTNWPSDAGSDPNTTPVTKTVSPKADAKLLKSAEPTIGATGADIIPPTGYTLEGWYTDSGCTSQVTFGTDESDTAATDISTITAAGSTLYAKWAKGTAVRFLENKGDATALETKYIPNGAADRTVAAPATDPSKNGYAFAGWYYDVSGTETEFKPSGDANATTFAESEAGYDVYAKWHKIITITYFDADGAEIAGSKQENVEAGVGTFNAPDVADDTANGKYFAGWTNNADGSDYTIPADKVVPADTTGDITLKAKMTEQFTVTFVIPGVGAGGADVELGKKYSNPVTPAALGSNMLKAEDCAATFKLYGKKFESWNTASDGSGDAFTSSTVVTQSQTVYAQTTDLVKVEFYENTGDTTPKTTKYVEDGQTKLAASDIPAETDLSGIGITVGADQRFKGWFLADGTTKFDENSTVTANTKVYAKIVDVYTVKFYNNLTNATAGAEAGKLKEVEVESGEKVAAADVTAATTALGNMTTGNFHNGWLKLDGSAIDFTNDTITADTTVYAKIDTGYKVEYFMSQDDADGNTNAVHTDYVNPVGDKKVAALYTATAADLNNKIFDKWVLSGTTDEFTTDTVLSGDTKVVAVTKTKSTVTFKKNDGTEADHEGAVIATLEVDPSKAISAQTGITVPADPTRIGYTFAGWTENSNGTGTKYNNKAAVEAATFASNATLYAQWTPTTDPVTLTFNTNMADVTVTPSTISKNKNDTVYKADIPADPSKEGYQFDGWTKTNSPLDTDYVDFENAGLQLTEDTNVYAHWTYVGPNPAPVTVTYKDSANDSVLGTVQVPPNVALGNFLPQTNPIKAGFTFKEWNLDNTGTGTPVTSAYEPASDVTIYARWYSDITVHFNGNDGTPANTDVTAPATDKYAEPTAPTRTAADGTQYSFLGWNTAANGSGKYILTGNDVTYLKVAEDCTPSTAAETLTEVTLYAQWGAVTPPAPGETPNPNPTPDPAKKGAKVTFDSNAPADEANVKDAVQKVIVPVFGDAIGTNHMPNVPERDKYVWQSWNTKADGTGKPVDGTTVIDNTAAGLGDALKQIGTTTSYEATVYAQWAPKPDQTNTHTLTFMDNAYKTNGGNKVHDYVVVDGDKLGFDVTEPANKPNASSVFLGYYEGTADGSGNVTLTDNKFNKDAAVTADKTYYAKWVRQLWVEVKNSAITDAVTQTFAYNGAVQVPYYTVYETMVDPTDATKTNRVKDPNNKVAEGLATDTAIAAMFDFVYTDANDNSNTPIDFKNAGDYKVSMPIKAADLKEAGTEVVFADDRLVMAKAKINVIVDPATQVRNFTGSAVDKADITLDTTQLQGTDTITDISDLMTVTYKQVTQTTGSADANNLKIDTAGGLSVVADTALTDRGFYVVEVVPSTDNTNHPLAKNYEVNDVVSKTAGENVIFYTAAMDTTTGRPGYDPLPAEKSKIIAFEVKVNDPSLASLSAKSVIKKTDEADKETELTFKDMTYKADKLFSDEQAEQKYYVVVPKDTSSIKVTYSPKYSIATGKVSLGTTEFTSTDNGDGSFTAEVTNLDKDNVNEIKVTMSTEGAADKVYTIYVKPSAAKITLNPGNSPYGEIMNDPAITDKAAAKAAFDASNRFTAANKPAGITSESMKYSVNAWNKATDSEHNMDRNDYAIFVYQKQTFKDPGFEAMDSLGDAVDAENIKRSIKIKRLTGRNISENLNASPYVDIEVTGKPADYIFTEVTNDSKYIRPDVYDMVYSFEDPHTGETITETRKVIILFKRGDTNLDNSVNATDQTLIMNRVNGQPLYDAGIDSTTNPGEPMPIVPATAANLFVYRTVDTNMDGSINATDQTLIMNRVNGTAITEFYRALK